MSTTLRNVAMPEAGVEVVQPPQFFDVTEQAELAVKTYHSLGFRILDWSGAVEEYRDEFQRLHDVLTTEPPTGKIEAFMAIDLSDEFGISALVSAFDKKSPHGRFSEKIWNNYTPAQLNRRSVAKEPRPSAQPWRALAMVSSDKTDIEMSTVHFSNMPVEGEDGQIAAARNAEEQHDEIHSVTELLIANPADVLILEAQRREQQQLPLSLTTKTRFVQLPLYERIDAFGTRMQIPSAYRYDGYTCLTELSPAAARRVGVRLLLGQTQRT